MKYNIYETLLGLFIIGVFFLGLIFSYQHSEKIPSEKQYTVLAKFQDVGGIVKGSSVKVSGIKIGNVANTKLDKDLFALVELKLNSSVALPKDSSISIVSDGLLGNKFMQVIPGSENEVLQDGDEIIYTESALSIEGIVQKLLYKFTTTLPTP